MCVGALLSRSSLCFTIESVLDLSLISYHLLSNLISSNLISPSSSPPFEGLDALARTDEYDQVRSIADYYAEYKALFEDSGNNPGMLLSLLLLLLLLLLSLLLLVHRQLLRGVHGSLLGLGQQSRF